MLKAPLIFKTSLKGNTLNVGYEVNDHLGSAYEENNKYFILPL